MVVCGGLLAGLCPSRRAYSSFRSVLPSSLQPRRWQPAQLLQVRSCHACIHVICRPVDQSTNQPLARSHSHMHIHTHLVLSVITYEAALSTPGNRNTAAPSSLARRLLLAPGRLCHISSSSSSRSRASSFVVVARPFSASPHQQRTPAHHQRGGIMTAAAAGAPPTGGDGSANGGGSGSVSGSNGVVQKAK